jgi:hypothetical protein
MSFVLIWDSVNLTFVLSMSRLNWAVPRIDHSRTSNWFANWSHLNEDFNFGYNDWLLLFIIIITSLVTVIKHLTSKLYTLMWIHKKAGYFEGVWSRGLFTPKYIPLFPSQTTIETKNLTLNPLSAYFCSTFIWKRGDSEKSVFIVPYKMCSEYS